MNCSQLTPFPGFTRILFILSFFFILCSLQAQTKTFSYDNEGYWETDDGISLYHFHEGQGKKVLFLHGGPGIPVIKPPTALTLLEEDLEIWYYHQRGCGYSTLPVDKFSSPNFLENMRSLFEKLGLDRQLADIDAIRMELGEEKLILVGHSFGGFLATLYAARYPEKVEKLVLIAPANILKLPIQGGGLYDTVEKYLADSPLLPDFKEYMSGMFQYNNIFMRDEAWLRDQANAFIFFWQEANRIAGRNTKMPSPVWELTGGWMPNAIYFEQGASYDLRSELDSITVPALILYGDQELLPPESVSDYVNGIDDSTLEVIPGGGHFVFEDNPEETAAYIRNFLLD